jgi:hypothetical protein
MESKPETLPRLIELQTRAVVMRTYRTSIMARESKTDRIQSIKEIDTLISGYYREPIS